MTGYCFVIGSILLLASSTVTAVQPADQTQPVSVGIVLDTSGSMGTRMALARGLVSALAKSAGSHDEFALIQASDRPVVLSGFVSAGDAPEHISFLQARGRSALLDAVYLGSQLMKASRHARKALLVISDGDDNSSRYTAAEIRESIRQAGIRVYTVRTTTPQASEPAAPELLPQLGEQGRGAHFTVEQSSDLQTFARELTAALRARP